MIRVTSKVVKDNSVVRVFRTLSLDRVCMYVCVCVRECVCEYVRMRLCAWDGECA